MSQYALPLGNAPIYNRDTFILADSNRLAFEQVTGTWNDYALILWGQQGCGKTHLGHIWAAEHYATILTGDTPLPTPSQVRGAVLIEDIELLPDEPALFHLLNHCKAAGIPLLMTAQSPIKELGFTLPDLLSRLKALPVAHISEPDDALLAACLRKQFADRQLKIEEEVIAYIVPRIERSFPAISRLVEEIDRLSLEQKKSITVPFIRTILKDTP